MSRGSKKREKQDKQRKRQSSAKNKFKNSARYIEGSGGSKYARKMRGEEPGQAPVALFSDNAPAIVERSSEKDAGPRYYPDGKHQEYVPSFDDQSRTLVTVAIAGAADINTDGFGFHGLRPAGEDIRPEEGLPCFLAAEFQGDEWVITRNVEVAEGNVRSEIIERESFLSEDYCARTLKAWVDSCCHRHGLETVRLQSNPFPQAHIITNRTNVSLFSRALDYGYY